jgi:phage terminase small subunit
MDDIKRRPPSTPKGLDLTGKRMWKRIISAYELRPDEQILLESACKTADLVIRLESAMEGQPLVVKGSMGQAREHPLLSEARQQRGLLARLLAQMKLPDEDLPSVSLRSEQARHAAKARWRT